MLPRGSLRDSSNHLFECSWPKLTRRIGTILAISYTYLLVAIAYPGRQRLVLLAGVQVELPIELPRELEVPLLLIAQARRTLLLLTIERTRSVRVRVRRVP
jgi:hypothetical protein